MSFCGANTILVLCLGTHSLELLLLTQVDVSSLENSTGGPELTVAALPRTGEIVLLEMSQRFHLDHLEKVMDVAMKGCKDIHNILDLVVQKHVRRSASFGPEN